MNQDHIDQNDDGMDDIGRRYIARYGNVQIESNRQDTKGTGDTQSAYLEPLSLPSQTRTGSRTSSCRRSNDIGSSAVVVMV